LSVIPSDRERYVFGRQVTLKITKDGSEYTIAKAVSARLTWRYDTVEDDVIGDRNPLQGLTSFRGTVEVEGLWTTDDNFHELIAFDASGFSKVTKVVLEEKNPAGQTGTWTAYARMNEYEHVLAQDRFVRATVRGILTGEPHYTAPTP